MKLFKAVVYACLVYISIFVLFFITLAYLYGRDPQHFGEISAAIVLESLALCVACGIFTGLFCVGTIIMGKWMDSNMSFKECLKLG